MKFLSGTARIITAAAVVLVAGLAIVVFAQGTGKPDSDPKKWGITMILGGRGKEPAFISSDSLHKAIEGRDKKTFKVHYHDSEEDWKEGEAQFSMSDMSSPAREIGGGKSPITGLTVSGSNSIQKVAFPTVEDLKTFTSKLETPTPTATPTPSP